MEWTPEQVELLSKLWTEGLTTSEIGLRLGVSKNAVVGKAHRLSLVARPSPIKRNENSKPPQPKQPTLPPGKACCWPIGDPKKDGFHFCGKLAIPSKPYCLEHAAIAYINPKAKNEN